MFKNIIYKIRFKVIDCILAVISELVLYHIIEKNKTFRNMYVLSLLLLCSYQYV